MTAPLTLANVKRFVFAGDALFTVVSTTGKRNTFKVEKAKNKDVPTWWVSVLTGPENEADYTYVGGFFGELGEGRFKLTPMSRLPAEDPRVRGIGKFLDTVQHEGAMPGWVTEVWHSGRCGACGRTLTVPESIASGLGPECSKKGY